MLVTERIAPVATHVPTSELRRRRMFVALVVALACAGCEGASVDLARKGASDSHGDEAIPAQGPPDPQLERRLTEMYSEVNGLDGVQPRVRGGVVHLSGTAETVTLAHLAVALARRLEGVDYVSNEIRSNSDGWFSSILRTCAT